MDIKKIYERYSSGTSTPNIVEHFNDHSDVYNDFIDTLIENNNLTENEKESLMRIKERDIDKKDLLFNYLIGVFDIYTSSVQNEASKKDIKRARSSEQKERLSEVHLAYNKVRGSSETITREIQLNNYKYQSLLYDISILKTVLISVGVLTLIPVVGFFKIFPKKVVITLWIVILVCVFGYGGYSYYIKGDRDPKYFNKYSFNDPGPNFISGHLRDPNFDGLIDPKTLSVGNIDKYVTEIDNICRARGNINNETSSPSENAQENKETTSSTTESKPRNNNNSKPEPDIQTPSLTTATSLTTTTDKKTTTQSTKQENNTVQEEDDTWWITDKYNQFKDWSSTKFEEAKNSEFAQKVKDNKVPIFATIAVLAVICIGVIVYFRVYSVKSVSQNTPSVKSIPKIEAPSPPPKVGINPTLGTPQPPKVGINPTLGRPPTAANQ